MKLFEMNELFSPFSLVENIKWNPQIKMEEPIPYAKLLKSLVLRINNEMEKKFPTYPYRLKTLDNAPDWTGMAGKRLKIALLEKNEKIQNYEKYYYSAVFFLGQNRMTDVVTNVNYCPFFDDEQTSINYGALLQAHTIFKMVLTKLMLVLSEKNALPANFYLEDECNNTFFNEWANSNSIPIPKLFSQNFFKCSIFSKNKENDVYFIDRKDVEKQENNFRKQQLIHCFLQNNPDVFVMMSPTQLTNNEYIEHGYNVLFNFKGVKMNLKYGSGEYSIYHILKSFNVYGSNLEQHSSSMENISEESLKDEKAFTQFVSDYAESVELEYELNGKDYSYLFLNKFSQIRTAYQGLTTDTAMQMMDKICEITGKPLLELERELFRVKNYTPIQTTYFELDKTLLQLLIYRYQMDDSDDSSIYFVVNNKVLDTAAVIYTKYQCFSKDEYKEKEKVLKMQILTEAQQITEDSPTLVD